MTPCRACGKEPDACRCRHWCRECGCETNHTTRQHEEAASVRYYMCPLCFDDQGPFYAVQYRSTDPGPIDLCADCAAAVNALNQTGG